MEYEAKVKRAKARIEFLRKIHGLKHKEIYEAMGFSKQHYNYKYRKTSALSLKSVVNVVNFFGITEYDLLHSTDDEFNGLPIVYAYYRWSDAYEYYESLKLGDWDCDPFVTIEEVSN